MCLRSPPFLCSPFAPLLLCFLVRGADLLCAPLYPPHPNKASAISTQSPFPPSLYSGHIRGYKELQALPAPPWARSPQLLLWLLLLSLLWQAELASDHTCAIPVLLLSLQVPLETPPLMASS